MAYSGGDTSTQPLLGRASVDKDVDHFTSDKREDPTIKAFSCKLYILAVFCSFLAVLPCLVAVGKQVQLYVDYSNDLMCEHPLADWNLWSAILMCSFVGSFFSIIISLRWANVISDFVSWGLVYLFGTIVLLNIAMNIQGAVWVYSLDHYRHKCPKDLYDFTYYYLMVVYILQGLGMGLFCYLKIKPKHNTDEEAGYQTDTSKC